MWFIPITAVAAGFQVARNALQRGLLGDAGPWGATLVRFLFGLPFSLVFVAIAWAVWPDSSPHFTARFLIAAGMGAIAQIGATAALLTAMGRSGFALGAAFQQSSLPFAALIGWLALGEHEGPLGLAGVGLASLGVLVLSWPKKGVSRESWSGAIFGLISGACYAVALNAYRAADLAVEPDHAFFAAVVTSSSTQALQSVLLVGWLLMRDRRALVAVLRSWRASLGAGFAGATASAMWVTALALAPAAPVRAVGVIELPLSALVGRRLFAERLTASQLFWGAATAAGVVLAALG